jgi:protein TonB
VQVVHFHEQRIREVNAEFSSARIEAAGEVLVANPVWRTRTGVYDGQRAAAAITLPRRRGRPGMLLVTLALHAGILAIALLPKSHDRLSSELPAVEAQIISLPPPHREKLPSLALNLTEPRVKLITPVIQIDETYSPAPAPQPATPVAAAVAAAPSKADPGPTEPVSPPRFDAAYLNNPAPTYPPVSRRLHEQGTVLMRVRVSRQGAAEEVLIEHTSGSQRLDTAAMDAVRRWRFVPAHRGNEAVEAWVLVPIEFEMRH